MGFIPTHQPPFPPQSPQNPSTPTHLPFADPTAGPSNIQNPETVGDDERDPVRVEEDRTVVSRALSQEKQPNAYSYESEPLSLVLLTHPLRLEILCHVHPNPTYLITHVGLLSSPATLKLAQTTWQPAHLLQMCLPHQSTRIDPPCNTEESLVHWVRCMMNPSDTLLPHVRPPLGM